MQYTQYECPNLTHGKFQFGTSPESMMHYDHSTSQLTGKGDRRKRTANQAQTQELRSIMKLQPYEPMHPGHNPALLSPFCIYHPLHACRIVQHASCPLSSLPTHCTSAIIEVQVTNRCSHDQAIRAISEGSTEQYPSRAYLLHQQSLYICRGQSG